MIEKTAFGKTGHDSTRIIFGGAALGAMRQDRADRILETLLKFGINHIDVAISYGDAELRVGEWMTQYRNRFFLATKTGERTAEAAKKSIHRSLERLQTDHVDLIQFHNLTDEPGWETAMGPDGALAAAAAAKAEGLVKNIGVTGHGTLAPQMHMRSLERFAFDSVLCPYNFMLMQNPDYAADFNRLRQICSERGIALQTIKSIARRRWQPDDPAKRFSWYEPVKDPEVIKTIVYWVLDQPGLFLNTTSDATLLPHILAAAVAHNSENRSDREKAAVAAEMEQYAADMAMAPIFIRGVADGV